MIWTKICGIKTSSVCRIVADSGATAIGLNFYSKSCRYVKPEDAAEICRSADPSLETVGLFVNASPREIRLVLDTVRLTALQIHGDETPADLAMIQSACPEVELIRALRMDASGLSSADAYLAECDRRGVRLKACLIDALVDGTYGGTGHTVPWDVLTTADRTAWPPLILAGGLKVDNVAEAIATVQPWGIDTASGVESSRGEKDPVRIKQFVAEVRRASA